MTGLYQLGRGADIFLFGPFLIWLGLTADLPRWAKGLLVAGGVLTMASNIRNFYLIDQVATGAASCDTLLGMGELY